MLDLEQCNPAAEPVAKGILPSCKQSFRDLFIWKQRVEVTNSDGEKHTEWQSPELLKNPITLLGQLSARDWLFFVAGFLAWTADAFDFHALSIQTVKLAAYYGQSKSSVTTAITLTLLLRSIGAAGFGLAGDRFGRKWPMVLNMVILGALQIATIYCSTFQLFLAVRALFGLFMGGVYGNAIAMALEHCPTHSRGLMSGILQQGYSFGYVIAACANLGVGGSTESWKTVFWIGAGLSLGVGVLRILFPESEHFIAAKKSRAEEKSKPGTFWTQIKKMFAHEWKMVVYCIILMAWFNYLSHTTQDSYTTFLRTQKELDNGQASRASIIMKTGACIGGTIIGYLSQLIGRRRAIITSALIAAALIPAWVLPEGRSKLSASGFFMQFFVQGAFGVIPIHLNELSPPAFRSSFPGVTYQVGNMIASPAAQIINALAESHHRKGPNGKEVDAYGPVMAIATAIITLGIVVTTALGPEKRGRHFYTEPPAGTNAAKPTNDRVAGTIGPATSSQDAEEQPPTKERDDCVAERSGSNTSRGSEATLCEVANKAFNPSDR